MKGNKTVNESSVEESNSRVLTGFLWLTLTTLVAVHIVLVVGMISAFFVLPFKTEWYIAIPLMSFIFFFSTTRVECKLTKLENYLRKQLGLPLIGAFVGHYFVRPIKNLVRR